MDATVRACASLFHGVFAHCIPGAYSKVDQKKPSVDRCGFLFSSFPLSSSQRFFQMKQSQMNREFNVWELRLGREDENFKRVYIAGIFLLFKNTMVNRHALRDRIEIFREIKLVHYS